MKRFLFQSSAAFNAPGDPAGGTGGNPSAGAAPATPSATGAPDPSGAPSGQPPAGTPAPSPSASSAYRPQGLPDHLGGNDDKETIDKLFGAYQGARREMGDRGALPERPDGYKLEASDKLKPYVSNFDKDPVFARTREIFHAAGVTDKQFNKIVGPWLEALVDGGLVDAPQDANALLLSLAPSSAASLDEAGKKAAATQRVNNNIAWIDGAKRQGVFPAVDDGKGGTASPVADFFAAALASDPRAHAAVEWLRGQNAEPRPAMGGQAAAGVSDQAVKARLNDPRNDPRSTQFDRSFADETDRLSRAQWGDRRVA
jgi:hypothetical protein